jgi:hypothetical protein
LTKKAMVSLRVFVRRSSTENTKKQVAQPIQTVIQKLEGWLDSSICFQ